MPRFTRVLMLLAAMAALAAIPATATADGPTAQAAKRCGVGNTRGFGPTYLLSLSVRGTSCRNGRRLVRAYYNCRKRNGGRDGRCGRSLGYRCSERRYNKSRTSFDASAKCKKGGRRINHKYTQFI